MQIIAVDPDKEAYQIGVPFIKKAGVEHKINFIQSDAMSVLNDLIADVSVVSVAAAFNQTPLNLNGCVQGVKVYCIVGSRPRGPVRLLV